MNIKLTAFLAATALAATVALSSFVPVANAQALPPIVGPAMHFLQSLEQRVNALSQTVSNFADSFTTKQLTFDRATGNELDVQTLCIGSTCITETQLQALLAATAQQTMEMSVPDASIATSSPPVIQINGDNPAIIQVGDSYNDLGATITGPQQDLNLGIQTYLNGTLASNIVIDTTEAATDTIDYVATDQSGLTATSTRTVIIEPAAASSTEATSAAQ